ncbi:MAG TPA: hypothetical protein VMQ93_12160 [Novosphingobium sp.]|nr:hypothetical protein [Novosphingobium sp.]
MRAIWPDAPDSGIVETNVSVLPGLRGDGWNWDLSSGCGLQSHTDGFPGNCRYTAWTSNLDICKSTKEGRFGFGTDSSPGTEFRPRDVSPHRR